MSRTIPRAYVTAAWSKNRVDAEDQARKYCGELVKAGYLPLCPVLAFSGIISEDDPDGEKKRREMSEDLLKRARFLVVCGKKINDDVRADISVASLAGRLTADTSKSFLILVMVRSTVTTPVSWFSVSVRWSSATIKPKDILSV